VSDEAKEGIGAFRLFFLAEDDGDAPVRTT
jgi:hypothetical protein